MNIEDKFQVGTYMDYSNSNYGLNALRITIDKLTLWFSYRTIIAFNYDGHFVIRENDWSNTTGKHLNMIDNDKDIRKPSKEFNDELNILIELLNITLPNEDPYANCEQL